MKLPWYMKEVRHGKDTMVKFHWLWFYWQKAKFLFRKYF